MRIGKWILVALLLVVVVAVAIPVLRLALYEQTDDSAHLQAKRDYLQSLQGLAAAGERPNIVINTAG